MQVASLWLLYALIFLSGFAIATRSQMRSLLGRVILAVTAASAQLLLTIQILSLFHQLRELPLLGFNAVLAALVLFFTRPFRPDRLQIWQPLPTWQRTTIWENSFAFALLAAAAVSAILLAVMQTQLIPVGDSYHFSMPLYWKQHASVLPFPVANPRITSLVFASEALCFPAVLFAKSWAAYGVLAVLSRLLIIWLVVEIALKLGVPRAAALCAGALSAGYPPIAAPTPDMVLATMWFGAAIFFLLEARQFETDFHWSLGSSVLCLLMSCGTKNIVVLQGPLYLLFAVWLLRRRLFTWPGIRTVMLAGIAGFLCSSALWVSINNRLWFGDSRGPYVLKETVAIDFHPSAIWTRVVRGTVNAFADPIWLPRSMHDTYGSSLKKSVHLLGGQEHLSEDTVFYSFTGEALRPYSGLGLLGFCVLAPSLLVAILTSRRTKAQATQTAIPWLGLALALFTIASFVLYFALLRTQRIGLSRLMGSCVIVGAPLAALLLTRLWLRILTGGVLCGVLAASLVFHFAAVSRRAGGESPSWLAAKLSRLQNDHREYVDYRWGDEAPAKLTIRESYTLRELYALALTRIPPSSVCGFVSNFNSSETDLFGPDFSNTVISLQDYRTSEKFLPVPATVEFVISETGDFSGWDYQAAGFTPWLEIKREGEPVFAAVKRTGAGRD